jgi:Domain of unknown function (DUF4157)
METKGTTQLQRQSVTVMNQQSMCLQRSCACGQHTVAGGECEACRKNRESRREHAAVVPLPFSNIPQPTDDKGNSPEQTSPPGESRFAHDFSQIAVHTNTPTVQTKLEVNEPRDRYEQEADRIADQVLATPTNLAARGAPPRIQRFIGQAPGSVDTAPASVDHVLVSSGRPLDPALRQDMEQRFGHDFSEVRVHSNDAAERSARDVNAHAYTVGHNIVFGVGRFAPGTHDGRRLIAHELTHVVQQSGSEGTRAGQSGGKRDISSIAPVFSISRRESSDLSIQRDKAGTSSAAEEIQGSVVILPNVGGGEEIEKELLRQGILKPGDYSGWGKADGYYFYQQTGSVQYRVVDVLIIRNEKGDTTGYKVKSYLKGSLQGGTSSQEQKTTPSTKATEVPSTAKKPTPVTSQPPATSPQATRPHPKSNDEMLAEFKALPESIKDLLRGKKELKPENLEQLLRIANKLKQLQPEDLALYKLLAGKLVTDLDAFERSVDYFVQFKAQIKAQADVEKTKKEPTLEEKLSKTWSQFDEKKFGGMDVSQKEALARDIAVQQSNIQLEHMATHPGETAVGMVEGVVRVDKTAKAIAEDVKDAADGNKGAYTRIAGAVGAYNKYIAAAASIVFIALLFVPGVNLIELAAAGLAVATATIVLSVTESELRIKAAGEAKTPEDFKTETAKSAAAQTQAVVAVAMLALTLAMKIIARIPLPGRYQNVGEALKAAQTALLEKSGIGPAWQSIKTDLLGKLRASKQGLPEALTEQSKGISETARVVEGTSGDEFVKQLAAGDPKLADLGISSDQAKAIQQISGTPEGKSIPERLRQDSLKALQDAPVEAGKKVDQFLKNVDDSIQKVEKAQNQEQLKSAVDDANSRLSAEEQARQATKDEQAFVKKRLKAAAKRERDEKAASKARGKAKVEAAKTRTKAEIDDVKELKTQFLVEIDEANRRLKQRLSDSQRAELKSKRDDLARQYGILTDNQNKLQRQYEELEISQYERARSISYSDTAAKEVFGRSGGLDEMSGKKPAKPSIDHVVSIEEMSSYEGFDDLVREDLRDVLSRTDNLRLMEKDINSKKGIKRWRDWPEGRRFYGEVKWQQMVELESRLRTLIQEDIKARVAKRRR